MPYIKKERRAQFKKRAVYVAEAAEGRGDLNFTVCMMIDHYLKHRTDGRYEDYDGLIGMLESAKLEYWRRRMVVYETEKCVQNGEVFE